MIIDLLQRPIAFHPVLVDVTRSVTAALMLSQALYWSKRTKDADGWFYKSRDEWMDETRLSHEEQATARKRLISVGIWQERQERLLHRTWFRVDLEKLELLLTSRETGNDVSPNREPRRGEAVDHGVPDKAFTVSSIVADTTAHTTAQITNTTRKRDEITDQRFYVFWDLYPNKLARLDAWKAWNKIKPDTETFNAIMNGLALWNVSMPWEDSKFIPHPATWLNGQRWTDTPAPRKIAAPEKPKTVGVDFTLDAEEQAMLDEYSRGCAENIAKMSPEQQAKFKFPWTK